MPNWCNNIATLKFKEAEQAKDFYDKVEATKDSQEQIVFGVLLPRPADQEKNWWEWNNKNWGTKWEPNLDFIELKDSEVFMVFDTAWSPPIYWYEYITQQYDIEVDATYLEWGMCFCGIWENGDEWYFDEITSELPQRLLDDYNILENLEAMEEDDETIPNNI